MTAIAHTSVSPDFIMKPTHTQLPSFSLPFEKVCTETDFLREQVAGPTFAYTAAWMEGTRSSWSHKSTLARHPTLVL
jgi:hypothetical protein